LDEEEDNSKKGEARSHKIFSSDKFNIFNVTDNPRVSGETEAVTDNAKNELLREEDEVDLKEEESVIKKETIFEELSSQEEESYELEEPDKEEEVDWHKILQSNKNNHTPKEQEEQETVRKEENTLKMPNLKSYDGFEEQEVPPLHLACTAVETLDQFPVKGDMNFSKEFGIESQYFNVLHQYLSGENVQGRNISLNFPVFLSVTPKSNNTVERAICLWLSSFSSLVPPEMDRHLGFLEIPQPVNNNIEIYASGKHVKFTRSFTGDASDWLYRKEVKSLMDDIIANGIGDITDFGSYMIEMAGATKHSVSFRKRVLTRH